MTAEPGRFAEIAKEVFAPGARRANRPVKSLGINGFLVDGNLHTVNKLKTGRIESLDPNQISGYYTVQSHIEMLKKHPELITDITSVAKLDENSVGYLSVEAMQEAGLYKGNTKALQALAENIDVNSYWGMNLATKLLESGDLDDQPEIVADLIKKIRLQNGHGYGDQLLQAFMFRDDFLKGNSEAIEAIAEIIDPNVYSGQRVIHSLNERGLLKGQDIALKIIHSNTGPDNHLAHRSIGR